MGAYSMTSPCDNCPFRTDIKPYLRPERVREIERSLDRAEFACHKTTKHDGECDPVDTGKEIHCAGALILLEKLERPSQMMRICERLGMYDRTKLDMNAPVFDSFDEMMKAQRRSTRKSARYGLKRMSETARRER